MSEPSTAGAERLVLLLAGLGHVVTAATEAVVADPELATASAVLVLCDVDLHGPRRPGQLVEAVGLSSGGMSKLLDRMEATGVIKRSYGKVPGDNRGVLVTITARGRRTVRALAAEVAARIPDARPLLDELAALVDG